MNCRFQNYIDQLEDFEQEYYQTALDRWNEQTLQNAHKIAETLEKAGCFEPEGWVFSEINENIAQAARYSFLKQFRQVVVKNAPMNILATLKNQDEICNQAIEKIDSVLTQVEKEKLFEDYSILLGWDFVHMVDEGYNSTSEHLPGWRLIEVNPKTDELSGRDIGGLHEDYFSDDFSHRVK